MFKAGTWLATIQQHFIEGRNRDMVVRVSIEQPASKCMRADDGIATRNGANRRQQESFFNIPCHSVILTSRSRYFDAALNGAYRENQQKRVEIVLADARAVDDLKLLIKLSYGLSYVQDGDVRIPKFTRLRLAFLANAFEFVECVQECLQSLGEEELTLEDSFRLLDEMPEELWEHEAAMTIKSKIIEIMKEKLNEITSHSGEGQADAEAAAAAAALTNGVRKALQQAGEALAKALGFVDKMFDETPTKTGYISYPGSAFYTVLPLRTDIKKISPDVMEVLLGSKTLQLRSENDAYYLLCAWLSQSPRISDEVERQALFKQILPHLRFHHMSLDFLGVVVTACPYANEPSLLSYIFSCSTTLRTMLRDLATKEDVNVGSKDRRTGDLECTFKSKINLADLLPLKEHPLEPYQTHKVIGLALGYPVALDVVHNEKGLMGLYVLVEMPSCQGLDVEGGIGRGAGFNYSLKVGNKKINGKKIFSNSAHSSWGWQDFFQKSWAEVLCPDSPCFPQGIMAGEMTIKLLTQD